MEYLFVCLARAVEGAPALALGSAAAWGVLSILLSPCHLSSIPLIVGFIGSQDSLTARRAFSLASAFALGILVTIALIGVVTAALGRLAGDLGGVANVLVAALFFLVGLHLLDVVPLPLGAADPGRVRQRGLAAALFLGLVFGVALGPCTFAFMAPVLAVTFRMAAAQPIYAASLLLAYGAGHCAVIVAAGTSTHAVQRYLSWNRGTRGAEILRRACGVLVIGGGLYLLYTAR
ncbi:MAG: cytochrome C biogenesis protein [Armatimonadetes bacterium]|nr:cytochrome C biogenesis protein [Armatimonadota bacterium]